eukprot:CFRG0592T1
MKILKEKGTENDKQNVRMPQDDSLPMLHVLVISCTGIPADGFRAKRSKVVVRVKVAGREAKTSTGVRSDGLIKWGLKDVSTSGDITEAQSHSKIAEEDLGAGGDTSVDVEDLSNKFVEGEALCIPVEAHSVDFKDYMDITVQMKGSLFNLTSGALMKSRVSMTEPELVSFDDMEPEIPICNVEGYSPGHAELSRTVCLSVRLALVRKGHPMHMYGTHRFWANTLAGALVKNVVSAPVYHPSSWSTSGALQASDDDDPTGILLGTGEDRSLVDKSGAESVEEGNQMSSPKVPKITRTNIDDDNSVQTERGSSLTGSTVNGDSKDKKSSWGLSTLQKSAKEKAGSLIKSSTALAEKKGGEYEEGIKSIAGYRLFIRMHKGHDLRWPHMVLTDHQKSVLKVFGTCKVGKQTFDTPLAHDTIPSPEWHYSDCMNEDIVFDVFKTAEILDIKIRMRHPSGIGPRHFVAGCRIPLTTVKILKNSETPEDVEMEWISVSSHKSKAKYSNTRSQFGTEDEKVSVYSDGLSSKIEENMDGSVAMKICLVSPEHSLYQSEKLFWIKSVCRGPKVAATWRMHMKIIAGFNITDTFKGPEALRAHRRKIMRPIVTAKCRDQLESTGMGSRIPVCFWDAGQGEMVFDMHKIDSEREIELTVSLQVPENYPFASLRSSKVGTATVRLADIAVLNQKQSADSVGETYVYLYKKGIQTGQLRLQCVSVPPTHQLNRSINFWSSTVESLRSPIGIVRLAVKKAKIRKTTNAAVQVGTPDKYYCIIQHEGVFKRTPSIAGLTPKWEIANFDFTVFEISTSTIVYVFVDGTDKFIGSYMFKLSNLRANRCYSTWVPLVRKSNKRMYKLSGEILIEAQLRCSVTAALPMYIKPIVTASLNPSKSALEKELTRVGIHKRTIKYFTRDPTKVFTSKLTKSHVWRIVSMAGPFKLIGQVLDYVMEWKDPFFSLFINLLWCFYCHNSQLLLPHIMLWVASFCMWYRSTMENLPNRQLPQILQDIQDEDSNDEDEPEQEDVDAVLENDVPPTSLSKSDPDSTGTSKKTKTGSSAPSNPIAQLQHTINVITKAMLTVQNKLGLVASLMESVVTPLTWDDPRITLLISGSCFVLAILQLTIFPSRWVFTVLGLILFRHPILRSDGSVVANFISRLPNRQREVELLM